MKSYTLVTRVRRWVLTLCLMSAAMPLLAAKNSTEPSLKVTLQEAVILQTLLQQVELSKEEASSFLAIQAPLEQVIAQQGEGASGEQKITLKLTEQNAQDLLVFMQRMLIKGSGAKQVDSIRKKVEKLLPKGAPLREQAPQSSQKVQFSLTPQESLLLQQQLLRIQVAIPELTAFLALYNPLEQGLAKAKDAGELVLQLPKQGPQNLLVFMQRFEIVGSQAQLVQHIVERLEQLREQK